MATHFIVNPISPVRPALRAVVADSERSARQAVTRILASDESIQLVSQCVDGKSAREAIAQHKPDVLFVDVELPDISGFDLVRSIGTIPAVVFVSSLVRHAAQAFDAHAVDFLIKPFANERVLEALMRAKLSLQRGPRSVIVPEQPFLAVEAGEAQSRSRFLDRITLRSGNVYVVKRLEVIECLTAAANYVVVHCQSESFRIRLSMNDLQKQLDPRQFLRIHRSAIINVDYLREFGPGPRGGYFVKLADGKELKMGRKYWPQFRETLTALRYVLQ